MAGTRENPYGAFNFVVEIDGIEAASFQEVTGLESTVDAIEYRNGSDSEIRKLPGLKKYPNLVLKRGLTGDHSLWEWHKAVRDGRMEQRTVTVVLHDETRQPVARFTFHNAWPVRWSGPDFDAGKSAVAIEALEICHEGIEFE